MEGLKKKDILLNLPAWVGIFVGGFAVFASVFFLAQSLLVSPLKRAEVYVAEYPPPPTSTSLSFEVPKTAVVGDKISVKVYLNTGGEEVKGVDAIIEVLYSFEPDFNVPIGEAVTIGEVTDTNLFNGNYTMKRWDTPYYKISASGGPATDGVKGDKLLFATLNIQVNKPGALGLKFAQDINNPTSTTDTNIIGVDSTGGVQELLTQMLPFASVRVTQTPPSPSPSPSPSPTQPPRPSPTPCLNKCGDGICQEEVCVAVDCPCSETPSSCPKDCLSNPYPSPTITPQKLTLKIDLSQLSGIYKERFSLFAYPAGMANVKEPEFFISGEIGENKIISAVINEDQLPQACKEKTCDLLLKTERHLGLLIKAVIEPGSIVTPSPSGVLIIGDLYPEYQERVLTGDDIINNFDVVYLLTQWAKGGRADLNNDGVVNSFDYSILVRNFGKTGPTYSISGVRKDCSPIVCTLYCPNGFALGSDGCPICQCREEEQPIKEPIEESIERPIEGPVEEGIEQPIEEPVEESI